MSWVGIKFTDRPSSNQYIRISAWIKFTGDALGDNDNSKIKIMGEEKSFDVDDSGDWKWVSEVGSAVSGGDR